MEMALKYDRYKVCRGAGSHSESVCPQHRTQANDLALLIARMQKSADQVEKDILYAEEKLAVDRENLRNEHPLQHQQENADFLAEAEGLLKDLYLDVDKAKKMKHPQASEIESDVSHLHDRWLKDCADYREIYELMKEVEVSPRIDWIQVLNQKQREVNAEQYGPTVSDLEKQIASHNILHKEIEAYGTQLNVSSGNSSDNSKWRRHYLSSLYDYMQGCNKEISYLGEEQKKILKQDWSDQIVDPQDVRRQYENFKNNSLLAHESDVNTLQDDGDRLIEMKHPASGIIEDHKEAVRNEWQKFLNLCICQEAHLKNVEDYKKFQLDLDMLNDSLAKLNANADPKALSNKTNTEILLQLEGDENAVQRSELLLADLKTRSANVAPLKLRHTKLSKPVTVESLCDWSSGKSSVTRGEKLILKSNANNENWQVQANNGVTKSIPGVCFTVPPPDLEMTDKVNRLGADLENLKKSRASVQASLKNPATEVIRQQKSGTMSSSPENPKAQEAASRLNKLDKDLAQTKQDMLKRMRAPLDRSDPVGDLANRLKQQEQSENALKNMEQETAAAQRAVEPFLSQKSSGSTSAALPLKMSNVKNKQDELAALTDLYKKKANASLNLENQIKKVDTMISGFEKQLSNDSTIPDLPNATQTRTQEIQRLRKDVASKQDEMSKLNKDLEATEQLCSTLQKSYQEYCPDIRRQENQVNCLRNRYATLSNQLQERERMLQEASKKKQSFENATRSLESFLDSLPDNKISPTDSLSQVNAKQTSQKRVVEDIRRKGDEVDQIVDLSQDLQTVITEYETNSNKFSNSLDESVATNSKRLHSSSLADSVRKQEKALVNRYADVSAKNEQLLNQMGLAKNIIAQNEEKVNQQVVKQQLQQQSFQRSQEETDGLKKNLEEETARRNHTESTLDTFRTRMMSLKSRRGVERVEEKEVLQYYRDPKLESDLDLLRNKIHEESLKRSSTQTQVEVTNEKIVFIEKELKNTKPKLVTKEVTEIEKDPQLDVEANKLREEIRRLRDELRTRENETVHMKTEYTILQQKKPTIKEKVVKKEVVRLEKNPEMLRAVKTFETEIADESLRCKALNDEIFQTRSQINTLERIIPTVEPKIITKEVKKVEQDPELIGESKRLRTLLDDQKTENNAIVRELKELQTRYIQVDQLKQNVEIKEIINEIYRVDPQTEMELVRLRNEIQDSARRRGNIEKETELVRIDLASLRSQKPKVETKEVLQEVVKEERSPEIMKEIQRLNEQVFRLQSSYDITQDQLLRLRKERDEWKAEKSKVETKLVTKDIIKYENDPLLEKEAERLRMELREETQRRRTTEETVFDLVNKYILLERQKPEEKVVVQEMVRLQKDPRQILDHEKLNRELDEEIKSRRQLELELQQLRALLLEKERSLRDMDERQKKIQVEMELRQIKARIYELENAPPPIEEKIVIEEVLKVERDSKLEKMINGLRADLDRESSEILRLNRDIRNVTLKLDILQKEKSVEKTVYKEVIRVEKDQAVEAERAHLRDQATRERNSRRDMEDEIQRLSDKLNRFHSTKTNVSREANSVIQNRDNLLKEKENILRELRTLESERQDTTISFQQQSRLMSEISQKNRQKSIKMESDVQRLEREILNEKDKINKRENAIRELLNSMKKEDSAETRTSETNVSTKITILDPETGKDMSPYDAYMQGLIDRNQYIHLQELECDWEEIYTMGPDGETSLLQDRKSGKQYSIKDALKDGRLTQYDLQLYKENKMPISEFALLVAGDKKKTSFITPLKSSLTSISNTTRRSSPSSNEQLPICGIRDTSSDTCMSLRTAMASKLIDTNTGQKLLEAQAATGGIIDIGSKERYSVQRAAERGLVEAGQLQRLLNAQKAFTGIEDPITKERFSAGEAIQKGWIPKDSGMRYLEAQHLTGGLVDPSKSGRICLTDAVKLNMIDNNMLRELQEEYYYAKDLVDPITKEKLNYKQALARCKKDPATGLLFLPAAEASYNPSYSSHQVSYF
ncbi:envoplakin-like [Scleropages formosus]|uniref:Envoplakin-like n=1 Tax=Scleropages formosus TaxID=113540 RepID=A0A0P7VS73_SCLFO|nr:envoplakin-like [Scleropages formosus]